MPLVNSHSRRQEASIWCNTFRVKDRLGGHSARIFASEKGHYTEQDVIPALAPFGVSPASARLCDGAVVGDCGVLVLDAGGMVDQTADCALRRMRTFHLPRPFFMSFIFGEFLAACLWSLIAWFWQLLTPTFPWP
jgi:hypothetical protein